ncbi:MAG: hypothetical protein GY839_01205 [candidate division Zixibacteria bacterium]|nr:hypothetical protein [candidate division Zixibacteria bacterium]
MIKDKIVITYQPSLDEEEKQIFEGAFGADNIAFSEYEAKGMHAGSFYIKFIVDLLGNQYLSVGLTLIGIVNILNIIIKKLFKRNSKNIASNGNRSRYTILILRMTKQWIKISNTDGEGKIRISRTTANLEVLKKDLNIEEQEYSKYRLEKYLKDEID